MGSFKIEANKEVIIVSGAGKCFGLIMKVNKKSFTVSNGTDLYRIDIETMKGSGEHSDVSVIESSPDNYLRVFKENTISKILDLKPDSNLSYLESLDVSDLQLIFQRLFLSSLRVQQ